MKHVDAPHAAHSPCSVCMRCLFSCAPVSAPSHPSLRLCQQAPRSTLQAVVMYVHVCVYIYVETGYCMQTSKACSTLMHPSSLYMIQPHICDILHAHAHKEHEYVSHLLLAQGRQLLCQVHFLLLVLIMHAPPLGASLLIVHIHARLTIATPRHGRRKNVGQIEQLRHGGFVVRHVHIVVWSACVGVLANRSSTRVPVYHAALCCMYAYAVCMHICV
jgi:hypothetical protein